MTDLAYGADHPSWDAAITTVSHNMIWANYGSSQGVDNDAGSSFYHIASNVFYSADGFKMDYGGHDSAFSSNLVLTLPYDSQNCVNVGSFRDGHGDTFANNSCVILGCAKPQCEDQLGHVAQCDPSKVHLAANRYYTAHGNASLDCGAAGMLSLAQAQARGLEHGSTAAKLPDEDELLAWARVRVAKWVPV